MELNLFEQAMMRRVRFETAKGTFTIEDLLIFHFLLIQNQT